MINVNRKTSVGYFRGEFSYRNLWIRYFNGRFSFFWCISALIYHRHCQCESRNVGHFPANLGNMNHTGPVRTELNSRRVHGREKGRLSSCIVPRLSVRPYTRTGKHFSFFFFYSPPSDVFGKSPPPWRTKTRVQYSNVPSVTFWTMAAA